MSLDQSASSDEPSPSSATSAASSSQTAGDHQLPPQLAEIVAAFAEAPRDLLLPMLVEYADAVPPLPADLADHPELMERVVECQTPFFVRAELAADGTVEMVFDAPLEAPTTRAFAGILLEGLSGLSAAEVLAVPDDFYQRMGLAGVISPLRLQGMSAILGRLKRQVRRLVAAQSVERPAAPGAA
jgi:cysteine desulfuration protein SufE